MSEKIVINCAYCSKPHRVFKDEVVKCDYYVCANKECSGELLSSIAKKNGGDITEIYYNLRQPIKKINKTLNGIDFAEFKDDNKLRFGLYGEQIIKYQGIFYMYIRTNLTPPSKRNDDEIEDFIFNIVHPHLVQKALIAAKDPNVFIEEFSKMAGNNIKEQIDFIRKGKYDYLDPVEYRDWKKQCI